MSQSHADLGPELRARAHCILDRLEPAVRATAGSVAGAGGPGKCQQVWCPVCALAALACGEQHPLLTVIAEHGVALLTVLRTMISDIESTPGPQQSPEDPPPDGPTAGGPSGYQHIPVTVEE